MIKIQVHDKINGKVEIRTYELKGQPQNIVFDRNKGYSEVWGYNINGVKVWGELVDIEPEYEQVK